MKVRNISNNTLYAEDIDMHFPYKNGNIEEIDSDLIKKSRCLRGFLIDEKAFDIVEYNEQERIETSLMYMRQQKSSMYQSGLFSTEQKIEPEVLNHIDSKIELKICGMFYDAGGYSKVNRNVAIKLNEMGYRVKIEPKRSHNQLLEKELKDFIDLEKTDISRNHILIDSVIPSFSESPSGKYKVLYTTIESSTIPKQFLDSCELYDEIWLTSSWSAEILKKYITDKEIFVMSPGVDPDLYKETGSVFNLKPNIKDFVFVSVFGWGYRKGYDVLIKAYFDEFSSDDNVSLLLMTRYQNSSNKFNKDKIKIDIEKIMQEFPNKDLPHLVRFSQVLPEEQMPLLYRSANCFVLFSRGEGICLPPMEASMCGLPIITTNWSGQTEYVNNDRSYLLEIDGLEQIRSGQMHVHYWDGQEFPVLKSPETHRDARKLMRHVYENYSEAQLKNRKLQKYLLENMTWNNCANKISNRIKEIDEKIRK